MDLFTETCLLGINSLIDDKYFINKNKITVG